MTALATEKCFLVGLTLKLRRTEKVVFVGADQQFP